MKQKPDCNLGKRPAVIRVGNNDPSAGIKKYISMQFALSVLAGVVAIMFTGGMLYNEVTGTYKDDMADIKSDVRLITDSCHRMEMVVQKHEERIHGCERQMDVIKERVK